MWYPVRTPFGSKGARHLMSKCVEPLAVTSNVTGGPGSVSKVWYVITVKE